jgi:uncharacterized protein (DUF362 family)
MTMAKNHFLSRRSFLKLAGVSAASAMLVGCQGQVTPTPAPSYTAVAPTNTIIPPTNAPTASPIPATITPIPSQTPTVTATLTATPTLTPTPLDPATTVAITQAASYDRKLVRQQVQAALEALGGIEDIVRPGDSVALKPNLTGGVWATSLFERAPIESWVTHPEVLRATGELLLDAGAKQIYIVEGVADDQSYRDWGYEEIAQSLGATLVDLNMPAPYSSFDYAYPGENWLVFERFTLNRVLSEVNVFVSLPKLKCHWTCGVTVAMKNLVGIAPLPSYRVKEEDTYRSSLHGLDETGKSRIPKVVIDLVRTRPIQLSIVDGIKTVDGGEGPWQKLGAQDAGVLLAGKNPVATDTVATAVMGFDPTLEYPASPFFQTYNHLNLAQQAGLGTNHLDQVTITGTPLADVRQQFKPST